LDLKVFLIWFRFKVNDSFKVYSWHPITVPKSQVDYDLLQKQGLHEGDLTIVFPHGERVRGHMYYGRAGYGPYYQVRTYTDQEIPSYLKDRDKVLVILVKDGSEKYAVLEFRS
jgi:hypothetical protein